MHGSGFKDVGALLFRLRTGFRMVGDRVEGSGVEVAGWRLTP